MHALSGALTRRVRSAKWQRDREVNSPPGAVLRGENTDSAALPYQINVVEQIHDTDPALDFPESGHEETARNRRVHLHIRMLRFQIGEAEMVSISPDSVRHQ